MDGLHLLAQVVLPLRLLDLVLHLGLNLRTQLLDLKLLGQVTVNHLQSALHVISFEDLLFVFGRKKWQGRGDKIHQTARLVDVDGHGLQLVGERGRSGYDLLEQGKHIALKGLNLRRLLWLHVRQRLHVRSQKGRELCKFLELGPLQALCKHKQALVGHLHNLVNGRERTNTVEVGRLGSIHPSFTLGHHEDGFLLPQGINELDGALPSDSKWQDSMGKQHRIPHRQDRNWLIPGGRTYRYD